jgi:hypothetical protein
MSDYVPGSATTTGATPPNTSSTAAGSTPPTTTSTAAPAVASQQTTPGAATSVASGPLVDTSSIMSMLSVSFGVILYLVFGYGAAKLSYDKFGSVGWAILDFIFSSFYYPYYALFLNTPSPALGIVGAARKWRK